nr:Gag-Pol polyprotein [Tanacetum cinerariifolium]
MKLRKRHERDRNSKPSVMTPARFQCATADSKPKPRSTNHSSRSFPMSKSGCVTMPVMPKADHSKSPRHKFSPNKTFAMYEKISHRSDLRWQPTGRIFKSGGLRWLPTGKLFDSCTNKVESEPPHGSNVDISKIHEYKQTLDLSAGTSINVSKEQRLDVSACILWNVNKENLRTMASDQNSSDPAPECQTMELNHDSLSPTIQRQGKVTQADRTITMSNELDLLFSPMFDELLNGSSKVVSKSSDVSAADAPNQHDEFINIFSTPVQDQGEMSSRHVDSSNMHTFYQRFPSEHRWTKDHPLEQVIGNPLQSIRTRRQLESDAEICMFALTVSRTEPKNIKEAMADSAWIESM